jgi:hypothetical protein
VARRGKRAWVLFLGVVVVFRWAIRDGVGVGGEEGADRARDL